MAFVLAGVIAVVTLGVCVLEVFAVSMSPSGSVEMINKVPYHFGIGMLIAVLVAAIHCLLILFFVSK